MKYQKLFDKLHELGITALESDMQEIVSICDEINTTEASILNLPSDDEIELRALKYSIGCYEDYIAGCNFIIDYKKNIL
jgi:hypothetical protein